MKTEDLETLARTVGYVKNRVRFRLDLADENSSFVSYAAYINTFPPMERENFKELQDVINHVLVNIWRDLRYHTKSLGLKNPKPVLEFLMKVEAVAEQVKSKQLSKYEAIKILGVE